MRRPRPGALMTMKSPTLRTVILRHKAAVAGGIALLFVLVAVMAATAVSSSSGGALGDSSSCSEWASASQAQQNAYSHLYVNEYGALRSGARDVDSVESAVDKACIQAAYLGEADDVSVVAAIKHQY
jgi:hypothetical protein